MEGSTCEFWARGDSTLLPQGGEDATVTCQQNNDQHANFSRRKEWDETEDEDEFILVFYAITGDSEQRTED